VRPVEQEVEVYAPGKPPEVKRIGDMLDGGDVLPGFTMAVKDIFPKSEIIYKVVVNASDNPYATAEGAVRVSAIDSAGSVCCQMIAVNGLVH
jgi:hypothetical protein